MWQKLRSVGPGAMVAAAFIGPGTIITATRAGGSFGYTLLWAVIFSTGSCLVLQEMSARLGVVAQLGVGEALRQKIRTPVWRSVAAGFVLAAILIGNAAYESGNITGAAMGMEVLAPELSQWAIHPIVMLVGAVAFGLLLTGRYQWIESTLVGLVAIMGLVFLVTALLVRPDWSRVIEGAFSLSVPEDGWLTVIGLIGTTVVPYNLFLHASSAKQKWAASSRNDQGSESSRREALQAARLDTVLSVGLGGVITAAILIAAAGTSEQLADRTLDSPQSLSRSVGETLGSWAPYILCLGFLAAGLSSAVTAPLAAAFATAEVLGWKSNLNDPRFRAVWIIVLLTGIWFATRGIQPETLIFFAQVANGLLLPVVAMFLVWIMNDQRFMKDQSNGWASNGLGLLIIVVTLVIGARGIWTSDLVQTFLER